VKSEALAFKRIGAISHGHQTTKVAITWRPFETGSMIVLRPGLVYYKLMDFGACMAIAIKEYDYNLPRTLLNQSIRDL